MTVVRCQHQCCFPFRNLGVDISAFFQQELYNIRVTFVRRKN